jgi:glutathione S-transferase
MKLYDSRRAPNPRRVRWVMAEKGVEDIEIIQVDLFKNEHRDPAFLAKAGLANVPALELDDGLVITESLAICRFLETLHPEPNLFGRDPRETAIIEMWTRRAEMLLATPLMMTVRHSHPALASLETQSPAVADLNRGAASRAAVIFDRRLSQSAFIAADRVTIADIIAYTALDFARMAAFKVPPEAASLSAWMAVMRARPAATAGV